MEPLEGLQHVAQHVASPGVQTIQKHGSSLGENVGFYQVDLLSGRPSFWARLGGGTPNQRIAHHWEVEDMKTTDETDFGEEVGDLLKGRHAAPVLPGKETTKEVVKRP